MPIMIDILTSIESVIKNAKHVRIDNAAILAFVKTVSKSDFGKMEFTSNTTLKTLSESDHIAFTIVYAAINFCYWGEPKWTISLGDGDVDGSAAMYRALCMAIEDGRPLLRADYLASLTDSDLEEVLKGNIQIPLFHERRRILNDLGKMVSKTFHGNFSALLGGANYRARDIVKILVDSFPSVFNDIAQYQGKSVARAQLVPMYLEDLHTLGVIREKVTGMENLTAFADYKVPQLLRKAGILLYGEALANKVDSKKEVQSGSEEEVEIRAHTIWAVELVTRELKKVYPDITAKEADNIFWFRGQTKSPDDLPYHRTRTIWY